MTRDDEVDDWVQVAMENDAVVVEFLIHLYHHHHQSSPPPTKTDSLPLDWTVRQPRSKPLSLNSNSNINNNINIKNKNKNLLPPPPPPPPRSSPTTPLSWSTGGATATSQSGSGSAEESSRRPSPPITMKSPDVPRSKVTKRPRKKKTLADLKEEEMLLMKEKRHLKKELEALRLNIENQRAINQNFKRIKIDTLAAASTNDEMNQKVASDQVGEGVSYMKNGFCLPDLNIAFEEDL